MMTDYSEIKKRLSRVASLIDCGDLEEANSEINFMAGKGVTGNDLDFTLGGDRISALRRFLKKSRGERR